ncbi:MAG: S-methyl-5-thioribose-1-phosphate isomerase [Cyclobacteriaceae bacterium]|nr:S-methyl-5-thioribose-1-phosphate isomerase [Cyclobacteriaceae bacterium]
MKIGNRHYRTIWLDPADTTKICIIDQRNLPHEFTLETISTVAEMCTAIKDMHVRGAGLIGAAAGFGMYLAALEASGEPDFSSVIQQRAEILLRSRPTAVNLSWAVHRQIKALNETEGIAQKIAAALQTAQDIADEDAEHCRNIGMHGLPLITEISERKSGDPVNILTHCNAGWLAFVDYGSATSPIYRAHDQGIPVHVWVDETRPRNQGARLTAWELMQHGVPHTVISDNVGGHLMQHGQVDMVMVGTDRTTYTGDVANKIGTYLKALAAHDNQVPFYVALPSSTFDWTIEDGIRDIPIEQRDGAEVKYIQGWHKQQLKQVLLTPDSSEAVNYAFDVTPGRLITRLITERGICEPNAQSILELFPEKRPQ